MGAQPLTTADLLGALPVRPADGGWTGSGISMPKASWTFGGLVAAQALLAAMHECPAGWHPRSVATRFLRRAVPDRPLRHDVAHVADSTTFADRRVTVTQDGEVVAEVTVLAHQPDTTELVHHLPPRGATDRSPSEGPIRRGAGFDVVDLADPPTHSPAAAPPHHQQWVRAPGTPVEDPLTNAAVLVMASDVTLVAAAWRPIPGRSIVDVGSVISYGLGFTVWFHHPTAMADWHLLSAICPAAAAGRSLTFGSWHDQEGTLVASVALDAVMRVRDGLPA